MKLICNLVRRIVIVLAMGVACVAFGGGNSDARTAANVEARFVALNAVEMRNLGLKWNMLQNGVGIASANASAGISARKMPAHVKELTDETTGGRNAKASEKITYDPASKVGEIDAEGPRGAVGAPAGAMNVVNGYPKGFNETNEHERSQSNER